MKKWCRCNSYWKYIDLETNKSRKQITGYNTKLGKSFGQCINCSLFKWVDADYENMIVDLRDMNN